MMTRPLPRPAPTAPQRPQLTQREQEVAGVVGRRAAGIAFALFFSAHLPQLDYTAVFAPPNIEAALTAVCAAVAFYGAVYTATYLLTVYGVNVRRFLHPRTTPTDNVGTQHAASPAAPSTPAPTQPPLPVAAISSPPTSFERTLHPDGRFLAQNRLIDPRDYGVELDWLIQLASDRQNGRFATISLNQLHEAGIDRKQGAEEQDSPAHRLIELLEDNQLIQDNGDRRPYTWTTAGQQLFGGAA